MKWIQQSFTWFKSNGRQGLYVAVLSLGLLVLSSFLGFIGVWVASLGLIYIQAFLFLKLSRSSSSLYFRDFKEFKGHRALVLLSVLMAPTNMMMGTVVALAQGDQSWTAVLTIGGAFAIICSCIYILVFHAVGFVAIKQQNLVSAADSSLRGFRAHGRDLIGLGILVAVILAIGALPLGAGLFVALPLAFYSYYFSFRDLYVGT